MRLQCTRHNLPRAKLCVDRVMLSDSLVLHQTLLYKPQIRESFIMVTTCSPLDDADLRVADRRAPHILDILFKDFMESVLFF